MQGKERKKKKRDKKRTYDDTYTPTACCRPWTATTTAVSLAGSRVLLVSKNFLNLSASIVAEETMILREAAPTIQCSTTSITAAQEKPLKGCLHRSLP